MSQTIRVSERISGFLATWQSIFYVIVIAAGAALPSTFKPIGPYTAYLLGLIMFFVGVNISFSAFAEICKKPARVLLGIISHYTIMPIWAFILGTIGAHLGLPTPWVVGLMLLGTTAAGVASNLFSFLAGGDVAMAVTWTLFTTVLSPLVLPSLALLLVGAYVPVAFWPLFTDVCKLVILPIALALIVRATVPALVEKLKNIFPGIAIVTSCVILTSVGAGNVKYLTSLVVLIPLLLVGIFNIGGFCWGHLTGKYLWRWDSKLQRTLSIEVGTMNGGLAMVIALNRFGAEAALVPAMFAIFANIWGGAYSGYWARKLQAAKSNNLQSGPGPSVAQG